MTERVVSDQEVEHGMNVIAAYSEAMAEHYSRLPVPLCHFVPMDLEFDDSESGGGDCWFECRHCGHTKDVIYAKKTSLGAPQDGGSAAALF